jgi:hypothetical protein
MIAPMIDLRELARKLVRLEGLRWPVFISTWRLFARLSLILR